jgi:two-component system, LuxR family, response regulator FixJ
MSTTRTRTRRSSPARRQPGAPRKSPTAPLVAVVDDNADVCKAIAMTLATVGLQAKEFTDPIAFLDAFDPAQFGCVVLDVRMPRMSGLELQQVLNSRRVETPIVFVSGHGDIPMALAAVKAGALDFLEKPWRDQVLIDAVNEAIAVNARRRAANAEHEALRTRLEGLTVREREVAVEVAAGHNAADIAGRLGLSRRTVEMHRLRAMRRLGVHSSTELTRVIIEGRAAGIIT